MRSSRAMKRWRIGSCSCSRSRTADAHADDRPADRPRSVAPKVAACPGPADPGGDRLDQLGFSRLPTMNGVTPAEVRVAASQLTILVAFMFSGVLALGSTLVAAPSIASEIESGIALAILPRPIRRSEVLIGKWLGLAVLIAL